MGYRTLEISRAAEIHIKEGQLEITTEEGTIYVPIEDLNQIMVHGANIRLSTMDLSILSQNGVTLMTIDDRYLPTAMVLPFEGYAVVRSAIARKLVVTGFHPTFGIHHDSQLNAFNLADDLIEPYRPMVDLVAHDNLAANVQLTKQERRALAHVLHNACNVDGVKVNVMSAIDIMIESLRRIILDNSSEKIKLPVVLPIESMEGVTE